MVIWEHSVPERGSFELCLKRWFGVSQVEDNEGVGCGEYHGTARIPGAPFHHALGGATAGEQSVLWAWWKGKAWSYEVVWRIRIE